jgi:ABC-type lipoprotein export system ATPase subunit
VILVTHDPEVAQHAQRIISVRNGIIIEDRANEPVCEPAMA